MDQQEKDFAKELVEELIDAATDYGSSYKALTPESFQYSSDKAQKDLNHAAEKLYNWIDKQ